MSKELYVEALADAKKLKEIAEDNAKRALVEAVAPRIKELIEKELLSESSEMEEIAGEPGGTELSDDILTDAGHVGEPVDSPMFGSDDEEDEYGIDADSIDALNPLMNFQDSSDLTYLESKMFRLGEGLEKFKKAGNLLKSTGAYKNKIQEMISNVENMYSYVQESSMDPVKKSDYELKLESYFQTLKKLQEQNMSRRKYINEADITLKLTGLPDDVFSDEEILNSIGVDVITGGEGGEEPAEEEGEEEEGLGEEPSAEEGGEEEGLGEEEPAEEEGEEEEGGEEGGQQTQESRMFRNNTVVEIDEGMLRREISRMKMLREAKESGDAVVEIDEGMLRREISRMKMLREAAGQDDQEVQEQDDQGVEEMDELDQLDEQGDQDSEEMDELDELDQLDQDDEEEVEEMDELHGANQAYNQAKDSRQMGGNEAPKSMGPGAQGSKQDRSPMKESLRRRFIMEKRQAANLATRVRKLQLEASRAKARGERGKVAMLVNAISGLREKLNESTNRARNISRVLTESNSRGGHNLNGRPNRPAERSAETNLRNKLAETNLFNAKLIYTNKLLQNDSLSKRQKASVIERLDEARSLREVKLIYESLAKTLAGNSRPLSESADRKVLGSASRPTRPASTSLNEGVETDRWAKLAGITK